MIVPLLTALLAFVIGGLVVLLTGNDPIATYEAIWKGTGLQWLFPWTTGDDRDDRRAQPPADADPHDAADPDRPGRGVRVPGRPLQHRRQRPVHHGLDRRGLGRLVVRGHAGRPARPAGDGRGRARPAPSGPGSPGFLKATTGANEVISTIMLNYTAICIGVYLFGLGGPLQNDTDARCRCRTTSWRARSCRCSGATPILQGLHIGLFIALARCSCSGWSSTARPPATRSARWAEPRGRPLQRHERRQELRARDGRCGAFAGLAGALDVLGWQFRLATNDIQIASIGFFGIAVALLGRNTAIGTAAAALLFGALLQRDLAAQPRPDDLRAGARREPHVHHPGPRRLFVSADVLVLGSCGRQGLHRARHRPPGARHRARRGEAALGASP